MSSRPSASTCGATCVSRRSLLQGLGVAAVGGVALSACGQEPDDGAASARTSTAGAGDALAKVSDVPVGGGVVLAGAGIVLTQPVEGEIKAFSATCTHQGATVSAVKDGFIICPRHNSRFAVADGAPTAEGPAQTPLQSKAVTVADGQISLA